MSNRYLNGPGGIRKKVWTEKRCSHNLQSAHLGQRRICDLTAGLFSEVEKDSDLCKNCVCWLFLLVLLSRSEVAKTFIADSFPNVSEASRRGTTHNSHHTTGTS